MTDGPDRLTPAQRRAMETRSLILRAAAQLFARHGYGRTTMDQIACAAGTSKGALYHHFATKRALFDALVAERIAAFRALDEMAATSTSLHELLDSAVAFALSWYRSHPEYVALSLESRLQAGRAEGPIAEYLVEARTSIEGFLRTVLQRFGGQPCCDQFAVLVLGLMEGVCLQWSADPERIDLDALRAPLVEALERFLDRDAREHDFPPALDRTAPD
ncbi:MAG TPA: helix-turn-helix domain-containing protein [Candidatus Dormibacteraeota bacterium]|nr:helix-turn-helix domain-containing protein [Candidatus Dormibacteraeota bacterium]